MSEWKLKRFWKAVSVVDADGGFGVALDGRLVKTPAKATLVVPTRSMAEAIASEWDAQDGAVDTNSMPVTRSANSSIDKISAQRAEIVDMLAAYGDADLTCYRADAPAELVTRQADIWDPFLDWADKHFGARLVPRAGVMHAPQSPEALARLRAEVDGLDNFTLMAFHDLVTISGSLVLALAILNEHVSPDDGWIASRVDEIWQEEQWGADEEATEMAEYKRQAFLNAYHFALLTRV